mmetsp:Transcript_14754/g.22763  ORF Transcript_14754/g.22763 Transcript_14754/m.22763 type:complete len:135 (-) Transcript_14754:20-424(-)
MKAGNSKKLEVWIDEIFDYVLRFVVRKIIVSLLVQYLRSGTHVVGMAVLPFRFLEDPMSRAESRTIKCSLVSFGSASINCHHNIQTMVKTIISVDPKKAPWEQETPLHNRWHPDIPPVASVAEGEKFRKCFFNT